MSVAAVDLTAYLLERPNEPAGIHASVVHRIGRRIVSGDLAPGDLLPEQGELSRLMGVSRTVVREATKVLTAKGLVESRPRRGTLVLPRSSWRLLDPDVLTWQSEAGSDGGFLQSVFEVREIIEPAATRLAAERARVDEISDIEHAYEQMCTPGDDASYLRADIQFHGMLVAATHNDYLIQLVAAFGPALQAAFRRQEAMGGPPRAPGLVLHRDVLDAVTAHDAARASASMVALVNHSRRGALESLDQLNGDPEGGHKPDDVHRD